jgi:signal peptidase II
MATDSIASAKSSLAAISPNGWWAFGVALAAVAVDQLTKAFILYGLHLELGESVRLLPILSLTGVDNPGVTFGLLRADNPISLALLSLFAVAVVIVLAFLARRADRRLTAIGYGLIMGGALGNNLIDRVRLGHVTDFIDVSGLGFFPWVFNVADACIDIGVAVLLIDTFWTPPKPAPPKGEP